MTNIFDVIFLNNHLYVVDKDSEIIDWMINNDVEPILVKDFRTMPKSTKAIAYQWHGWMKIIASTDPSLKLPMLPAIEQDDEISHLIKTYKIYANEWHMKGEYDKEHIFIGIVRQLETISKKKYTEEDIKNAFDAARLISKDPRSDLERYFDDGIGIHNWKTPEHKNATEYLQSLHPTPKQVELEMLQETCEKCNGLGGSRCDCEKGSVYDNLKLIDNQVIVKRWIYEQTI